MEVQIMMQNEWTMPDVSLINPQTQFVVWTDASNEGIGAVITSEELEIVHIWQGDIPANLSTAHIFLKEMFAAIVYTRLLMERHQLALIRIPIVVDNSAVAYGLRAMYSSNHHARDWLASFSTLLTERRCSVEIIQVRSEDNLADSPSRKRKIGPSRFARGRMAYELYRVGRRSDPPEKPFLVQTDATVRHRAGIGWERLSKKTGESHVNPVVCADLPTDGATGDCDTSSDEDELPRTEIEIQ
jgi:hypothetical protein